jgi:lysophospholipase L1-like esterase
MNLEDKKIFVLGCSYSHHDGPMSRENDKKYDWNLSWPAMLAEEHNVKFVANGAVPGSGVDTLYQRAKILLEEYGEPHLVIVQLTYPNRFLWSSVPVRDTIEIRNINKKYSYFEYTESKWEKYAPITPGNINRSMYFIKTEDQRNMLEEFLLTDYFNTCTEKEIACLQKLFGTRIKFFTHGRYNKNTKKELKKTKHYLGDVIDWLDIPFWARNKPGKYFIDEHLHLTELGHRAVLEEILKRL